MLFPFSLLHGGKPTTALPAAKQLTGKRLREKERERLEKRSPSQTAAGSAAGPSTIPLTAGSVASPSTILRGGESVYYSAGAGFSVGWRVQRRVRLLFRRRRVQRRLARSAAGSAARPSTIPPAAGLAAAGGFSGGSVYYFAGGGFSGRLLLVRWRVQRPPTTRPEAGPSSPRFFAPFVSSTAAMNNKRFREDNTYSV